MMKLITIRRVTLTVFAAAALTLTACRDSSSASTGEDGSDAKAEARKSNEPGPPADYVRARCGNCSCRVFMGDEGHCTRPSCRHHWQEHQRPQQGS